MMKMKQFALATAATLALCTTAFANDGKMIDKDEYANAKPHHKHHDKCCNDGYNPNWAEGWYIGAGLNGDSGMTDQSSFGQVWEGGALAITTVNLEKNENNIGWDVYVGRKVSKHFAFELGYTGNGNQHFKGDVFSASAGALVPAKSEVKQWNVHGVGLLHMPIGHYFNVFAKGGIAYYQNETTLTAVDPTDAIAAGSLETSKLNTFALTYGAGIELTWDQFGVRGEYTVVAPSFNNQENFYISDLVGASIYYRFM